MIIKNEISELERFQTEFAVFAEEQGISITTAQEVQVVFEDLLANIVFYAFDDGEEHEIEISMEVTRNGLMFTVVDDGLPFNPLEAEKPDLTLGLQEREIGGLGIHLVLNLMDEITYNRRDDQNVLVLIKSLD